MIDTEQCKGCKHNPKSIYFPNIVVCHHPSFHDRNSCPLVSDYDIGYKDGLKKCNSIVRDSIVFLLEQIKEKSAREIVVIMKEFIEGL